MDEKQCGFCEDGVFQTYMELLKHTWGDCPNFTPLACEELDREDRLTALSTNKDTK